MKLNDNVTGAYHNIPFTGKIVWAEAYTLGPGSTVEIALDTPITVYDIVRTSVSFRIDRSNIGPKAKMTNHSYIN